MVANSVGCGDNGGSLATCIGKVGNWKIFHNVPVTQKVRHRRDKDSPWIYEPPFEIEQCGSIGWQFIPNDDNTGSLLFDRESFDMIPFFGTYAPAKGSGKWISNSPQQYFLCDPNGTRYQRIKVEFALYSSSIRQVILKFTNLDYPNRQSEEALLDINSTDWNAFPIYVIDPSQTYWEYLASSIDSFKVTEPLLTVTDSGGELLVTIDDETVYRVLLPYRPSQIEAIQDQFFPENRQTNIYSQEFRASDFNLNLNNSIDRERLKLITLGIDEYESGGRKRTRGVFQLGTSSKLFIDLQSPKCSQLYPSICWSCEDPDKCPPNTCFKWKCCRTGNISCYDGRGRLLKEVSPEYEDADCIS